MVFESKSALPHLLDPSLYHDAAQSQAEWECIFADAWHLVGTTAELQRDGDFLTCQIGDTAIQVRNFGGEIRALSNVCTHRHALICSEPSGNSSKMRCQYHGWEYQKDGLTGRIPQPKNFVPADRERWRLPSYALETCGQLVFVNLSSSPRSLDDFLGEKMYRRIKASFGSNWNLSLQWQPDYEANWKVPVENSLESYHVPNVHPETFREDPGADRSEHVLGDRYTAMGTQLPFSPHSRLDSTFQRLETRVVRWLGHSATGSYWQYHVFPNLLFSFTDAISLVNCVMPTGATTCRAIVRQFGRGPSSDRQNALRGWFSKRWAKLTAGITKKILIEDQGIFASIQQGLTASPHRDEHRGVLGICEERIHCFQRYVKEKLALGDARDSRSTR